ncbi:MAG: ABC transporter substrate-binding protein [Bacteroidales bacterium]|nr:ABC transporter substrate-binding protein [Bacteroidales bacterium]
MKVRVLGIILLSFLVSCNVNEHKQTNNNSNLKQEILTYAKGFDIKTNQNYKLLTIHNPWQGAQKVEYKYLLVNKGSVVPDVKADIVIETPVERVVCLSTTHIAFIDILNETQTVYGVSGKDYINNPKVRDRIEKNEVLDVGFDNSLNYELIAGLNPDLVITYGIGSQVAGYNQKLNDLGIKTIICAEYLENHPLGKLEWVKFLASFYNKEDQANQYFENIETEYNNLLEVVNSSIEKPKVLFGLPWKDSWYVPGGQSYLAKMVEDAGGEYIWKENESRESTPYDIESMFVLASKADVWLNTGSVNSKEDILKIDTRFKNFEPFNKSEIFNNNNRINKYGGNDYWETGLVEPQLVLKDMIQIFHPELLSDHKLVYYKHIE